MGREHVFSALIAIAIGVVPLAGCVGYDDAADTASSQARALGLTREEESRIRGALDQQALTAEEIARTERELERDLPTDWKAQSLSDVAKARRSVADWGTCIGDINCVSGHCSQANVCVPSSEFKSFNEPCAYSWECASSVCGDVTTASRSGRGFVTSRRCLTPRASDSNGIKDSGETGIDCGGTASPFACPVDSACTTDDDCVAGYCIKTRTTCPGALGCTLLDGVRGYRDAKSCKLQKGNATDLGRAWPRANATGSSAPYPRSVALPAELDGVAQAAAVRAAPQLYSGRTKVAAEQTRNYQHDTCVKHLVANGCSTVSVQTRSHRAAYDLMICPKSARATKVGSVVSRGIRIPLRETFRAAAGPIPATLDYGSESDRGSLSVDDDPYLCNHSFTRGVRFLSKSGPGVTAGFGAVNAAATDISGVGSKWDGYAVSQMSATERSKAVAWFEDLQRFLLVNAACTRGRVYLNGARQGSSPAWNLASTSDARIKTLCDAYAPWTVTGVVQSTVALGQEGLPTPTVAPASLSALPSALGTLPSMGGLSQEQLAFVRQNVPWHTASDIYSIDPEGNPYMPSNENMQYGWDAMHVGFSFSEYASSWGAVLVPTNTAYDFGGASFSVWGTSSTATFGWGF